MLKDNVAPIKSSSVTIDSVKKALNSWRLTKENRNAKIPEDLWEQIAVLLTLHSEREVRSALILTPIQMERAKQSASVQHGLKETNVSRPMEPIDFCEAQEPASFPLAYCQMALNFDPQMALKIDPSRCEKNDRLGRFILSQIRSICCHNTLL